MSPGKGIYARRAILTPLRVGEEAHHVGAPLDLLVEPLPGVVAPELPPMLRRKPELGQHVRFGLVEPRGQAREPAAEAIRAPPLLLPGGRGLRLGEHGADRGDHQPRRRPGDQR
jgi:hypothetical protein